MLFPRLEKQHHPSPQPSSRTSDATALRKFSASVHPLHCGKRAATFALPTNDATMSLFVQYFRLERNLPITCCMEVRTQKSAGKKLGRFASVANWGALATALVCWQQHWSARRAVSRGFTSCIPIIWRKDRSLLQPQQRIHPLQILRIHRPYPI